MNEILDKIDETLTYHSAGLGADVTVPVERDLPDLLARMLDPSVLITPAVVRFDAGLRRFLDEVSQAMRPLNDAFAEMARGFESNLWIFDELHKADEERRARLRRMHQLYRHRRH
jgi:hypothetical protein